MPSPTKSQIIAKMSVQEAREALEAAIARQDKETEKRNRDFRKMSKRNKRVTIARDVLAQLELGRLVPRFGVYLDVSREADVKFETYSDKYDEDLGVDKALEGAKCEVCGIGSLFVAAVDRADACTVGEMDSPNDDRFMREYLGEWFDSSQLSMIESAFEGKPFYPDDVFPEVELVTRSIAFTSRVMTPTGRLRKIMQNIVDNDGIFKP